jgi:poly-gamma-glutamate capsule biosynthesis protein CapA/YwtB (metallophosphatase superfamily)
VTTKLALAGDTMLGRGVAERLKSIPPESLFAPEVVDVAREADLFVLNLECCISDRGSPWPSPGKPFFFRAPPQAVDALTELGVDCVTLANNHALDFGEEALLDTLENLRAAGIACVGAGRSVDEARRSVVLQADDFRLGVLGVCDHPADFAAGPDSPGVAFADLRDGVPDWLLASIGTIQADAVLVSPHWGPNMSPEPVRRVRESAPAFIRAGASLVAGHSAHVFQGVEGRVLYDLGDFVDDYRTDPAYRNDLGLLFLVTLDRGNLLRLEAVPLKLEFCHTRLADGEDGQWIRRRFRAACAGFGTEVVDDRGRLVVTWS